MPAASHGLIGTFTVTIDGEPVTIPDRVYNSEPRHPERLTDLQRRILHCVYSRHHDGFVRQTHLRELLHCHEPWIAPFVVKLVGEYVLPIVEDVWTAISDDPAERETLRRFARENPTFMELTRQRAISYWNA
jgi:hypothetical protein